MNDSNIENPIILDRPSYRLGSRFDDCDDELAEESDDEESEED